MNEKIVKTIFQGLFPEVPLKGAFRRLRLEPTYLLGQNPKRNYTGRALSCDCRWTSSEGDLPKKSQAGMFVKIFLPQKGQGRMFARIGSPPSILAPTQLCETHVPKGVKPGSPFALMAGGVPVFLICPSNARPGQWIRFRLPVEVKTGKRPKQSCWQGWKMYWRGRNFWFLVC